MERQPYKISLLNLPVAGDVDTSTVADEIRITGLMPIKKANYKGYQLITAAAEVQQVYTLDGTSSVTVVAGRKYKLMIGNVRNKDGEAIGGLKPIGATAPSILTGTAASDRANIYESLAYKINQNTSLNVTAYVLVTLTHATDTADPFVVGDVVTGATSGATGILITRTSVTVMTVAQLPSATQFTSSENISSPNAAAVAMTAAPTLGVGIRIVDNAGYYDYRNMRVGATSVIVAGGFAASNLVLTTAAVYSVGQGTRMLQDKPYREISSDNLATGSFQYPGNQDPVAGQAYNGFVINDNPEAPAQSSISNSVKVLNRQQVVWADNDAAGYAAFLAAIAALTIT